MKLEQLEETFSYWSMAKTKAEQFLEKCIEMQREEKKELEALGRVEEVVFEAGNEAQEMVLQVFSEIGTECLEAVFGGDYRYRMLGKISRGSFAVEHVVFDDNENEIDPLLAMGGGVVDILSFALRFTLLLFSGDRRLLILDEPFRFLSRDRVPIMSEVLDNLCEEYGVQIILVTHCPELSGT